MIFFVAKNLNEKKKIFLVVCFVFFLGGGGERGLEQVIFFKKNQNLNFFY